ncbi:hypothetical protein ACFFRR_006453 [Megaselia abdita]
MSLQMQSNATVGRKGSLSLGNGNNNSQAKTKQQKIVDCIELADDQNAKKNNGKDKKFTNGSGNSSSNNKTNDKNGKKTEEKALVDKEKSAAVVKKTSSDEKINQEKKKVVVEDKEKNKAKDVKKTPSNDVPAKKEEKPKPSTPTLTGKKVTKVESSNKDEKVQEKQKPVEKPKVEEKAKEEPTTTSEPPSPAKKKTEVESTKKEEEPMATEVSTTTTITVEEPKPSPRKVVEKKQTPEPVMFAEKDLVISSTPAKPSGESALANQKKISKSSDNMTSITLSEVKTYPLDRSSCPTSYRNISGRRSLRPMKDYVFQHSSSSSLRESYRKINTELDVGNISNNTSLNVTVGSEVPSNWSFSFLGRSRKRDRTPPNLDTSTGVNDMDTSPTSPKRPRFDFSGFVGILSSPVTMLRERLARAKIQNTPHKLRTSEEDICEVANLSSVSNEEDEKPTVAEDIQIDVDIEALKEQDKEENKENVEGEQPSIGEEALDSDEGETEVRETEPKKRGCSIM